MSAKEGARLMFGAGVLWLLCWTQALTACDEQQPEERNAMVGREGSGSAGPGTPAHPSTEPSKPEDDRRDEVPNKTVHSPGTPMSPEEFERRKREAERPSGSPSEPSDKGD
jgi:hypothetical protein